jgi:hypothetical protein
MASSSYKITSPEGAERYGQEEGAVVELVLKADEERALVAAGWLEKKKKEKADK